MGALNFFDIFSDFITYWYVRSLAPAALLARRSFGRSLGYDMMSLCPARLPFYYILKLAVVVYLWHPRTRGIKTVHDLLIKVLLHTDR